MPDEIIRHRITTTTTDAGGNTIVGTRDTETVGFGLFAPTPTSDVLGPGRDGTEQLPTVYFEGWHPDIVDSDQLEVRGVTYDIAGVVAAWEDGGTAIQLRRVDG